MTPYRLILIGLILCTNLWIVFMEPSLGVWLFFLFLIGLAMGRLGLLWLFAAIVGFITGIS